MAEWYNRTVLDKARCLIFDANMHRNLWDEAVGTAIYLNNRTASRTLTNNQCPAEIWLGKKTKFED